MNHKDDDDDENDDDGLLDLAHASAPMIPTIYYMYFVCVYCKRFSDCSLPV